MDSSIEPYRIEIPDWTVQRLQQKLALSTLPGDKDSSNDWKYGAPYRDIKRLVDYWKSSYDWRKAEKQLNQLPHFTTTVSVAGHGSLKIHFVHQKSSNANSIPLLFCHGWPGSFLEVTKILPSLVTASESSAQTFHVVAPSLPNCGFSQHTSKPGFGALQYAEVCHKLMLQLGYQQYVTQAGDWGFPITRAMGMIYPDSILASHLNFVLAAPPSPVRTPLLVLQYLTGRYSSSEKAGLARTQWFRKEGSGYNQVQSTKPHTLGFLLADSPVGVLAWIYEKLHDWSDSYPWTDEEVLTWISIFIFSEAGADASIQLYYELVNPPEAINHSIDGSMEAFMRWSPTPLGLSYFPKDVVVLPSSWGRTLGPVVYEKRHAEGGHFAAYEKPELLVEDIRETVKKIVPRAK